MISICCPTRGRPERFIRMLDSAKATATNEFEVIAWLDDNDPTFSSYPHDEVVTYAGGPRPYIDGSLCTSGLWTDAWRLASGDIAMLAADDIIFKTVGWDARVENAINAVPDRLVMVYADDGTTRKAPVNPFVSREWIETTGEFTPPGFQGWMADEWIWHLAAELHRVVFLSDVRIRHLQRRGSDQTYRDGEQARADAGGLEGMRARFYSASMMEHRERQLERLYRVTTHTAAMWGTVDLEPQPMSGWWWYVEALERSERARGVNA